MWLTIWKVKTYIFLLFIFFISCLLVEPFVLMESLWECWQSWDNPTSPTVKHPLTAVQGCKQKTRPRTVSLAPYHGLSLILWNFCHQDLMPYSFLHHARYNPPKPDLAHFKSTLFHPRSHSCLPCSITHPWASKMLNSEANISVFWAGREQTPVFT